MPETFEITKVDTEFSTWTAKEGPAAGQEFRSYKVSAKGPDGELHDFEINRKPNSGPPPLGVVEAERQPSNGNFPDKLKLTPQGRSNGSSGGFKPDPERSRRIERQHSQEMALRWMAMNAPLDKAIDWRDSIREWTDWFQADLDVDGGGDAVRANESSLSSSPAATAVSARTGFASDKQKNFFERLLKQASLDSNQVAGVVRFTEQLPTERVSKAIDGLNDDEQERAEKTVAALIRESDAWARLQSDVPFDADA